MMINFRGIILPAALSLAIISGCMIDSPERQTAHKTLARWEDQRLAPEDSLLGMIESDDAHVRLRALRTAGLIGRRSMVPAMVKALEDQSETVGKQAAFSLGMMGDAAAVPALEAILMLPGSRLHLAAARGLAHLDHEGQGLLKALSSEDPLVVAAAWDGLRNMASKTDSTLLTAAITEGLNSGHSDILWRVLRCAERVPARELIPHLAAHVRSNQIQVRVHAFRALAKQKDSSALKAALQGYQQEAPAGDGRQRIMIAACRAFSALGVYGFGPGNSLSHEDQRVLTEALIEGAGHGNPHLAVTALAAMEKLAYSFDLPPEAARQESLLPVWRIRMGRAAHSHFQSRHPVIRAAAIRSWAALRGAGSEMELRQMLMGTPSSSDLEAILFSLGRQAEFPYETLSIRANKKSDGVLVRLAALEALHHLGTNSDDADDRGLVLDQLTLAATDPDFAIAATAIGYLADFPDRLSLVAMVETWDTIYPEGEAEVKRAVLASLKSFGPQAAQLKRSGLPDGLEDRLLLSATTLLSKAFDSPDLRLRLEARETALATGLLPPRLIPDKGSLRATLPAYHRHPDQPAVRTPFSAPKVLCTTDAGTFVIQLNGELAPNTCAMFMDLINRGFYDDLTFHRVVPDFVAQGGDPRADGWGGPGYNIRSEWSHTPYKRAAVGIAHDGKDTGGSQFFITLSEQPHLNGRYTIFGEVIEGMDVVNFLEVGHHFHLKILP